MNIVPPSSGRETPIAAALLSRLRAQANQRPPTSRLDFEIDGLVIGSVEPEDARLLVARVPGLAIDDDVLTVTPVCAPDAPSALAAIARTLLEAGRVRHWRDEALPVCADDGTLVGTVERCCVRALGIRTFAVHLVGESADSTACRRRLWLQRRALGKAVDPGMLDTLAGGLVGMQADGRAHEPFALALLREIGEEAGLEPHEFESPRFVDRIRIERPVQDGWMVEDLLVHHARLRAGARPSNRDGEVSEFVEVGGEELFGLIEAGALTFEAAIASLICLR